MADIFSSMGASIGGFAWSSLGNIVTVIVIFLIVIVFFSVVLFLMWWKSYNYRVRIYEPVGQQLTTKEIDELKNKTPEEVTAILETKKIKFNHIRYRVTHGKYATLKGIQQFVTFMPGTKLAPVPMTLLYDDGIHLLKLSRNLLVPIQRPNVVIEINTSLSLFVEEAQQWQNFNNLLSDRINNKYQELDTPKKMAFYFVVGIVAIVLLGSLVIYLIYKSSTKGMTEGIQIADKFNQVADKIVGGGKVPA
jgi:hypothetical protein